MSHPEHLQIGYDLAFAVKAEISTMPLGVVRQQEHAAMHPLLAGYEVGMHAATEAQRDIVTADKLRTGMLLAHRIIRHADYTPRLDQAVLSELQRTTGRFAVGRLLDDKLKADVYATIDTDYSASPGVMSLIHSLGSDETKLGTMIMFGIHGEHANKAKQRSSLRVITAA